MDVDDEGKVQVLLGDKLELATELKIKILLLFEDGSSYFLVVK